MRNMPGDFIWYELMTSDMAGATAFYESVIGWTVGASTQAAMDYRMIEASDGAVAGMMQIDAEMAAHGARPAWLPYIGVADVDATADAILAAGGRLFVPPRDIPGIGRFAMAGDPHGAAFYVMRGFPDQRSDAFAPGKAGHGCWQELSTPDQPAAHQFYAALFGWRQTETMALPDGGYCFLDAGEQRIGATMRREGQASWLTYFEVPSIARSIAAIEAGGGTVTSGPHEVPGGSIVITGIDPQGARFGLAGGR